MDEALPITEITFWKNDEQVAHADHCGPIMLGVAGEWSLVDRLSCYYFSAVRLASPVVFEHLAGRALSYFLDHCMLRFSDGEVQDLRYIHGRSEVMKGRHKVGAVLLAGVTPKEGLTEQAWLSYLPSIYKEFLAKYQAETKTA